MFKGRQFDQSVILLCVRWYLAYSLSLRDLEEMMAERGIAVDHFWGVCYPCLWLAWASQHYTCCLADVHPTRAGARRGALAP